MNLAAALVIFVISIILSLIFDINMMAPLALGMVLFVIAAMSKGYDLKQIAAMAWVSVRECFIVVSILLIIGCLTGIWRLSGTIAYFVTAGISYMPKTLFILSAFLLTALMSYAIGTSFGVTATAGVIIMSIARAGGIDPVPVAGAVFSGVYVGDRGSPASSCANLVASLTGTDMRINIRCMLRSSLVPFAFCCVLYTAMSFRFPLQNGDSSVLASLGQEFHLNWLCFVPALIMIILPFCRVKVKWAMAVSIAFSVVLALAVQKASPADCIKAAVLGYQAKNPELAGILSGGGIVSMLNVCGILLISGTYGGIFEGTGLLDGLTRKIISLKEKIGRYPAMLFLSVVMGMLFCNQTISCIMLNQLSAGLYGEGEEEKYRKMLDIADSAVLTAGMIPWCLACSGPMAMMEAGFKPLLFGFYLMLVPIWNLIFSGKRERYARYR